MLRFWLIVALVLGFVSMSAAAETTGTGPEIKRIDQPDVVLDWNEVLLMAVRTDPSQATPTDGTRDMAMVHAAIFDAINAIDPDRQPYALKYYRAPWGASKRAAASQAAWRVLTALFPSQKDLFNQALANELALVDDDRAKRLGIQVGNAAAEAILELRAHDGHDRTVKYHPIDRPGYYQLTPPDYSQPLGVLWGQVTPFIIRRGDQFRADPPPRLTSLEYARAYCQVKTLGDATTESRTAEQTEIGIFWSYDQLGIKPPEIIYNQILRQIATDRKNSVEENAYLFAIVNLSMADAIIACWESKYFYNHWRPVTAIRAAYTDGNPYTRPDRDWLPLGGSPTTGAIENYTPNFPSYPSGHASLGETMFRILQRYYHTDRMTFTIGSDELPGVTRTYTSFTQASLENGISRVYLGVHWIYDITAGLIMGYQNGDYAYEHALLPLR